VRADEMGETERSEQDWDAMTRLPKRYAIKLPFFSAGLGYSYDLRQQCLKVVVHNSGQEVLKHQRDHVWYSKLLQQR